MVRSKQHEVGIGTKASRSEDKSGEKTRIKTIADKNEGKKKEKQSGRSVQWEGKNRGKRKRLNKVGNGQEGLQCRTSGGG